MQAIAELAAKADGGEPLLFGATASANQATVRVFRRLGNDIDHSVDGVFSPDGRAWPTDHLDAINVLERIIEGFPEHAGEDRLVDAAAVQENQ